MRVSGTDRGTAGAGAVRISGVTRVSAGRAPVAAYVRPTAMPRSFPRDATAAAVGKRKESYGTRTRAQPTIQPASFVRCMPLSNLWANPRGDLSPRHDMEPRARRVPWHCLELPGTALQPFSRCPGVP